MNRREFIHRSTALAGMAYLGSPALAETLQTLGDVRLTIGIVSDIHLRGQETAKTFIHTLEYFRDQRVDGVIIAGDMADQGLEPQLQVVANAWFQVFPDNKGLDGKLTEKLFIYGNHDVEGATWGGTINAVGAENAEKQSIGRRREEVWKKCFREDYTPIWMKTVKGYHFIGAHWHPNNIPGLADFLAEHAQELGTERPFFYIQHPHLKNTCNGPWAWGQDDGMVTGLLSKYPNAVAFSGHSHSPLGDDRDLWQGPFTSIGTASLSYLYPMPARENTYQDDWNKKPPTQMANMECSQGKQGMIMRVYDNCLTFERREFVYDQSLGDPWMLPWPISLREPLSFENRRQTAPIPQFAAGAKATVTQAKGKDRYGVEQQQVTVHFPNVLKRDTGVRAFDYEIQIEYTWCDVTFQTGMKRVFSPRCYMGEAQDQGEVICVYGEKELPWDFRFRFVIRPCECFGKKGDPIYTDWIDGKVPSALTAHIALDKKFYKVGEKVNIQFKDAPVGTDAWIGIYVHDKEPGSGNKSYAYQYTKVKEGTVSLTVNASDEYYAVLFQDGGYTECSQRIPFFVLNRTYDPTAFRMSTDKTVYDKGDAIRVRLENVPNLSKDWVGIYSADVTPRDVICPTWAYNTQVSHTLSLNVSGTRNWTAPLPAGVYFVGYFSSDGYTEPFDRQYFVIGKPATLRSERTEYTTADEVVLSYQGLHQQLHCQLCSQAVGETTWQVVQDLQGTQGIVELGKLQAGELKYCICLGGKPISSVCSLAVKSGESALGDVPQDVPMNSVAYRVDGTRAERMEAGGLYIVNGEKILKH